jgi:acetyl esterase/lipase
MINLKKLLMLTAFLGQFSVLSAKVIIAKNINYTDKNEERRQLNIYYQAYRPAKTVTPKAKDVIVFIHGGSWSSGKKDTYWWLGRNFARKGVVAVTINYGLAPVNQYEKMADDCANAVKWVQQHIAQYGGDPKRIFVMGHSAGGHLAALINADPRYFKRAGIQNPIRGIILDDPFGLDIKEYLATAVKDHWYDDFIRTFTTDSAVWEKASPLHYITQVKNPHLIFYGARTYPAIQIQSERMNKVLTQQKVPVSLKVIKGKKHVGMIAQMIFGGNQLYDDILGFVASN